VSVGQLKEMSTTPDVSVVMSVYNGASSLPETVDSILSQKDVSLEFIIVDDGSNDHTPQILENYVHRDSRIKVINQKNKGLTRALITGCSEATGKYIARQDVGDVSLEERLVRQLQCIESSPEAMFVSCGTRFFGPQREFLYDVNVDPVEATRRLLTLESDKLQGPSHHASAIFSRTAYEKVGGYRAAFYLAQDLDLWVRFAEHGLHIVMPQVLYHAAFAPCSLSGSYRAEQIQMTRLILESARRRRCGLNDEDVLDKARAITIDPTESRRHKRLRRAKALYFIGTCLRKNNDAGAARYFKQAFLADPLSIKSAVRLLMR
jgi:glycosyltransferase involved in cell wall biosynthesis